MPGNDLRLLALDGGGVRGLSALMILQQLMETVNPDAPPKPCDYFDMIGGTSTGGLIAVMLGRLRMSVTDCIDAYLSLSERVFQKKRHRVNVKGSIQGRFDSKELERAVREVIKKQGLHEDTLLKDQSENACKVFVCATSKEATGTVCLTSYRTARGSSDLLDSVKIWEACRATSAASSFFDPIAIGRYKERFVDGATGANNPVWELWDQAHQIWGPQPLDGKIKCLVSIGTGVPSLKPFKDDVLYLGKTLVEIATETEQTAERFRRDKSSLQSTSRYYRFNVSHGLEDIGLEEAKKVKEMAAATRRYIEMQEVHEQLKACAGSITGKEYTGKYATAFSLEGVPRVRHFVQRPQEMLTLEDALIPKQGELQRLQIYVLRGLGGMGKTQLAAEFARRHHRRYSAVFWLDGQSEDTLKRSIARCVDRIPRGQIADVSKSSGDIDLLVKDVMNWLAQPDNTNWLMIFDNVDREWSSNREDPQAYDIKRYLVTDHGFVLITTRLARLEQLGEYHRLGKVDSKQAKDIFTSWSTRKHDGEEVDTVLELLEGLPLAIAQAGAFIEESGVSITDYLRFYKKQWKELMGPNDSTKAPLQDYPDRSVGTTWAISYHAIRSKHKFAANLLLLWSFLNNKDLWYGLLATEGHNGESVAMLRDLIGPLSSDELAFIRAMQLLRSYSLVDKVEETGSYATHPLVHQWAYHYQGKTHESDLAQLALRVVAKAAAETRYRSSSWRRRLLPHVTPSYFRLLGSPKVYNVRATAVEERIYTVDSVVQIFELYYLLVVQGWEEELGPHHVSILKSKTELGAVYLARGMVTEAEHVFKTALRDQERVLGPEHKSTLDTLHNLGVLYRDQDKLAEAERMLGRALQGMENTMRHSDMDTRRVVNDIGLLYVKQGKLVEAEQMYMRSLQEREAALGNVDYITLTSADHLVSLYMKQRRIAKTRGVFELVLKWYKATNEDIGKWPYGLEGLRMLSTAYITQGDYDKALEVSSLFLSEQQTIYGPSHEKCRTFKIGFQIIDSSKGITYSVSN